MQATTVAPNSGQAGPLAASMAAFLPIHSLRNADHNAVGHDDRVIDHHPHGDDHCTERNPMKVDAHDGHDDERAENRKSNWFLAFVTAASRALISGELA